MNKNTTSLLVGLLVLGAAIAGGVWMKNNPNNPVSNQIANIASSTSVASVNNSTPGNLDEFYKAQFAPTQTYLNDMQKALGADKNLANFNLNGQLNIASGNQVNLPEMKLDLNVAGVMKYILSQNYADANFDIKGAFDGTKIAEAMNTKFNLGDLNLGLRYQGGKLLVNFGKMDISSDPSNPNLEFVKTGYSTFFSGNWLEIPMSGADSNSLMSSFDTTRSSKLMNNVLAEIISNPVISGQKIADGDYSQYSLDLNKDNILKIAQNISSNKEIAQSLGYTGADADLQNESAKVVSGVRENLKNISMSGFAYIKNNSDYKININSLIMSGENVMTGNIVKNGNNLTSSFTMLQTLSGTSTGMAKIDISGTPGNYNYVVTNLSGNTLLVKGNLTFSHSFGDKSGKTNYKLTFESEGSKINGYISDDEDFKEDTSINPSSMPTNIKTIDQLLGGLMGGGQTGPVMEQVESTGNTTQPVNQAMVLPTNTAATVVTGN